MNVYEMEGFLRGKCLPGDMKVNESDAQYLVRKFSELQSQNADMAVQLANAESKCRELQRDNDSLEAVAVSMRDDMREAREKLRAAEKRIAELEARTVTLPQYRNSPDMHTKQFYEAIGFNQGLDIFIEAIRAAGIGVKGE